MSKVISRTDLLGKATFFLLDITYAGRTFHLSSKTHDILKENGTSLKYQSGISLMTFDDELDFFGISPKHHNGRYVGSSILFYV